MIDPDRISLEDALTPDASPDQPDRRLEQLEGLTMVVHVTRGNLACAYPLNAAILATYPASTIAAGVAGAMLEQCQANPGLATDPVVEDAGARYALRRRGADELLDPDVPVLAQTEGHWRVETLPVEGQTEATARLPVGAFELVNAQRSIIHLPPGSARPA